MVHEPAGIIVSHRLSQPLKRPSRGTGGYGGDASGSSVDRSAVQWFKLNVAVGSSGLSYSASGRISDASASNPLSFYFPSQTPKGTSRNSLLKIKYEWINNMYVVI